MRLTTLIMTLALPLTTAQAQALPTGVVTLSGLRERARPLLIFAPKPNDPQLEAQLRRLHQAAAAMAERDVVAVALPYNSTSPTRAMLSDTDAQSARRRFHIAPGDFAVILIGKDGGEKLRSEKPLTVQKLCEVIDAMPMRQDEMKSQPHR